MDWFLKTGDAAFEGSVDLPAMITANELYFAFVDGATPDTSDTGHEFLADYTGAGGQILTEMQLTNASWTTRVLSSTDSSLTIPDPGGATTATHLVLYQKTGTASTARFLGSEDITDLTFDGQNDTLTLPSEILKAGS